MRAWHRPRMMSHELKGMMNSNSEAKVQIGKWGQGKAGKGEKYFLKIEEMVTYEN